MKEDKKKKKKNKKNDLKEKGVDLGAAVVGMGIAFVAGPKALIPSAGGLYLAKENWQKSAAIGGVLGSLAAGTHASTNTGDKMEDYKTDVKARSKNLVRGAARAFFVEDIAPEQFAKLDLALGSIEGDFVDDVDLEAAMEFARQLDVAQGRQEVAGIETYAPESRRVTMGSLDPYSTISQAA